MLVQKVKAVRSDLVDIARHRFAGFLIDKPGDVHCCRGERIPAAFAGFSGGLGEPAERPAFILAADQIGEIAAGQICAFALATDCPQGGLGFRRRDLALCDLHGQGRRDGRQAPGLSWGGRAVGSVRRFMSSISNAVEQSH